MKVGRKQKLKTGDEVDFIYARRIYCYLINKPQLKRKIKRGLNKRYRKEQNQMIMDGLNE